MDFISETKFNAPIKGCLSSTQGNGKGDLRIDSNLALDGNLCEDGSFSISGGIQVGPGGERGGVTIGNFNGDGGRGTVQGTRADFANGSFGTLSIGSNVGECGDRAMFSVGPSPSGICVFNELTVYDSMRFVMDEGEGNYDSCFWTLRNNHGRLEFTGSRYNDGLYIDNATLEVNSLKILSSDDPDGCEWRELGLELNGEKITSWSDLKQYVGGNENKIQRFTSPQLPANCSQFYFEGDGTVTGTELPFIQVRETATGKLWQMDVWVNLDEACSAFTLGKPVAEVEPCSSVIEAGKWTAIVMN